MPRSQNWILYWLILVDIQTYFPAASVILLIFAFLLKSNSINDLQQTFIFKVFKLCCTHTGMKSWPYQDEKHTRRCLDMTL